MTLQTILYFTSILLTCMLTGLLAWYASRQVPLPGVRAYAWLALSECLMALTDLISMLSGTQAQALFWFNLRFFFTAIIPVIWLAFALAYSGQQGWLSKRLLAGSLVIPVITQVMLWSNSLHGLWVKQEVAFHQNSSFWIAETNARIPGLWFMVHSFYSLILLLAGIVLIFLAAWRMRREHRGQALLLSIGALVALVITLIPVFNLLPQAEFNPFIPGIGISALLYALAVFRFQFLKRDPAQESAAHMTSLEPQDKRSLAIFIFVFILLASGLAAASALTYQNYEKQFRAQVESQLGAIAALKTDELQDWRAERLTDANLFYRNENFSERVRNYLDAPQDAEAQAKLLTWLEKVKASPEYDRVFLLDTRGVERISIPAAPEVVPATLAEQASKSLASDQIIFLDFHRHSNDDAVHLSLLVPIFDAQDNQPLGVLVLRIDPNIYLYPFIQRWPVPSESGETLLIRLNGEESVYLNSLRFQSDTALNLHFPLTETQIPAVKAVLGYEGIVAGVDYRGVEVIADIRAVPNSPWFLVSKIDTAEVYAPLRDRLWQTILFFGALILAVGAGLMLVWRQQRMLYYRGQVETLAALRASEEKFRLAFDTSPDSVAITRAKDGMFVSVNQGFEQITGYARQQVLGKTSLEINIWKDPEDRRKIVEGLRATGEVRNYEAPFLTRDGEIYGLMSAAIIQLNGEPHILNITRDITERKRAEEKLIDSEVRYRRLFEAARDGILILDAESGVVTDVNPFLIEMLGFPREEIVGKELWELGFFKDIAANKANFLELQQNEYIRYEDLPLETADGRRFRVEFVSNIYQVDHHKIVQCNIRDITERKRAEQQLANYTDHLEEMVDERTRELRTTQEQLVRQERLAMLGQLAGSIGHELRNPLGVISNAIYFLKMSQPHANDRIKEYLDIIENETRTSDKIITDLLDFTRIKAVDRQPISVSELVRQTLERYPAPPVVEVVLEIATELPPVYADSQHIIQVLGNLTVNACQAMVSTSSTSGVSAGLTTGVPEDRKLTISAVVQGDMIVIAVQDIGVGIPPENMKKLFEPLFTTKTKGIGLGLAVSKKLAEANGGRIEVHSEPDKGSTFSLFLPVYDANAVPIPAYHPESLTGRDQDKK